MYRFLLFLQAAVSQGAHHRPYHQVVALPTPLYLRAVQAVVCQCLQHRVLPAALPAAKRAAATAVPRHLQNQKPQDLHPAAPILRRC